MAEKVGGIYYDVALDTSGLIRGSRIVDAETAKAARSFNAITAAVKLYAAALTVVKSAQMADDMRLLSGRIEVATENLQKATAAMQALQRISSSTGTALEANVKVFTRLNPLIEQMGGNQNDTLRITELLGKALRVSGASAVETSSAMTQFAQAMGSGKLAGDELRSLMENAPYLMRQLAAGLGVPIGALKQLGEEGKLTADVVANALQKAAARIEDDFKKLPETLGTAMTVATDAAMRANEAFDTLTGTSAALTGATKGVGEVLDHLAKQFAAATSEGEKLGRNDTVKAWANGTFQALTYVVDAADVVVRVFKNIGIGIGAAAAAAVTAARGNFSQAREILADLDRRVDATNGAMLSGARMRQAAAALAVPDAYQNRLDRMAASGGPASNLRGSAGSGGGGGKPKKAAATKAEFPDALQGMLDRINSGDELKLAKLLDTLEEMKKFTAAGGTLPDSVWAQIAEDIAKIDPAAREARKALDLLADTPSGKQDALLAKIAEINRHYAEGRLTVEEWAAATRSATGTAGDGMERLNAILADTPTAKMNELLKDIEFINTQFAAGNIKSAEQWAEAIRVATGTTENGVDAAEKGIDVARELGLTFSSAFEDAIVAGKGLQDVLKGLEQDILRILARKLVTEPLANVVTGALGSAFGSGGIGGIGGMLGQVGGSLIGSLFGAGGGYAGSLPSGLIPSGAPMAIGGGVEAGRLHRVNEKGRPEMFQGADGSQWMLPAQHGRVMPSGRAEKVAAGAVTNNNSFTFVLPPGGYTRATQQQIAAETARVVARANQRYN